MTTHEANAHLAHLIRSERSHLHLIAEVLDSHQLPIAAATLRRIIASSDATHDEQHPAGPLDEHDKRDRLDGGGCIWEWNDEAHTWQHVGRELPDAPDLATVDADAGPIEFHHTR